MILTQKKHLLIQSTNVVVVGNVSKRTLTVTSLWSYLNYNQIPPIIMYASNSEEFLFTAHFRSLQLF